MFKPRLARKKNWKRVFWARVARKTFSNESLSRCDRFFQFFCPNRSYPHDFWAVWNFWHAPRVFDRSEFGFGFGFDFDFYFDFEMFCTLQILKFVGYRTLQIDRTLQLEKACNRRDGQIQEMITRDALKPLRKASRAHCFNAWRCLKRHEHTALTYDIA